jgi:hypothetical protein
MKKIITLIFLMTLMINIGVLSFNASARAIELPRPQFAMDCTPHKFFGLPTWYEYLPKPQPPNCEISFDAKSDLTKNIILVALAILKILLILAGIIAVFMVVMGGFKYVTSQGEPEKVGGAKNTLLNAVVGAMIAILATQVVGYIAFRFGANNTDDYGLPKLETQGVIGIVMSVFYTIIGAVSVFMIVYAGFKFIIAGGDPQKVATARKTIYYAIVGVAVAIFASALTSFVLGKLT